MTRLIRLGELFEIITTDLREWEGIVVHHIGAENKNDLSSAAFKKIYPIDKHWAESTDNYHKNVKKWPNGMAYPFMINHDGTIEVGSRWIHQLDGGHCRLPAETDKSTRAWYNIHYLGVCFAGNFEYMRPTYGQLVTGTLLFSTLSAACNFGTDKILPHRELKETACPGRHFDITIIKRLLDDPAAVIQSKIGGII